MMGEIRLWLDDVRDPSLFGCDGWYWAKTYEEAIEILKTGRVVEASLDHDLGRVEQMDREKTGYDVVTWMEEHDVWPREGVTVHSANPYGADRMRVVLSRIRMRHLRKKTEEYTP